jgi:V8-like Glu-specific endopeptidase
MKSLSIAMMAMFAINSINAYADPHNVVYGKDNRKDIFEVTNPLQLKLASSTVVLVKKSDITQISSGLMKINAESFENTMNVCKKEKYSDQPSGGFCSGTLIGTNLILTAGHCITSQSDCQATKFVFGYHVAKKGKNPSEVPSEDVVGCKSIKYRIQEGNGADFGIIELDRNINNHEPVKLAQRTTSNELVAGDKLLMIGHPAGLPTKVEDGGKVRDSSPSGFLIANTDSYGGNSGSGVFNQTTGELEGVLVRGEQDYKYENGCYVSNVCAEAGCRGEDITKVSTVLQQL